MLCIKTVVGTSKIHGLGLFADEDIKQGRVIWKFEAKLDGLLEVKDFKILSAAAQAQFLNYAFFDKVRGQYLLCGDDARFFNHSNTPNCDDGGEDITVALRDIRKGEELTVNYFSFEGDIKRHKFLEAYPMT